MMMLSMPTLIKSKILEASKMVGTSRKNFNEKRQRNLEVTRIRSRIIDQGISIKTLIVRIIERRDVTIKTLIVRITERRDVTIKTLIFRITERRDIINKTLIIRVTQRRDVTIGQRYKYSSRMIMRDMPPRTIFSKETVSKKINNNFQENNSSLAGQEAAILRVMTTGKKQVAMSEFYQTI